MKRLFAFGVFCTLIVCLGTALAGGRRNPDEVKEALQELNGFIGPWKGNGNLAEDRFKLWPEKADWSWRFKGKDAWLRFTVEGGKFFKGGDVRYLPDEEKYQLTALTADGKKAVFEGELKKGRLVVERKDPATGETQQLTLNNAADGIRLICTYKVKPANRTLFSDRFQVAYTKEGESLGSVKKKVECVVTGGEGTIAVSFGGQTYYVCCSGCRDAFNENPEKILAEYKKRKASGR